LTAIDDNINRRRQTNNNLIQVHVKWYRGCWWWRAFGSWAVNWRANQMGENETERAER